jgi:hypothetical protein
MDLKLIRHFASTSDARAARHAIAVLTEAAELERDEGRLEYGEPPQMFSSRLLETMSDVSVHSLGHGDLEQFLYEASVEVRDADVVIETEEIDVMAYLKVLIVKGARIEMYSGHDHDSGAGAV